MTTHCQCLLCLRAQIVVMDIEAHLRQGSTDLRINEHSETSKAPLVGLALGLTAAPFLIPFIAPLFAAGGLYGAAAVSSGLATLGGGSLAAGGLGMAGGATVIGVGAGVAGALTGTLVGPETTVDVYIRDILVYSGKMIIRNGNVTLINGKIYDTNGTMLYDGRFVNNRIH